MLPSKKYTSNYTNLDAVTASWLVELVKETNDVNIESILWWDKKDPRRTFQDIVIKDHNDNFLVTMILTSSNQKVLKYISYLFHQRLFTIKNLLNCYILEHKGKKDE
jgi:hypothetical protein